jgi:ribosomal protein L4
MSIRNPDIPLYGQDYCLRIAMTNANAERYRTLAAKAVDEAEKTKDAKAQLELLDIAERYERLAKWTEEPGTSLETRFRHK